MRRSKRKRQGKSEVKEIAALTGDEEECTPGTATARPIPAVVGAGGSKALAVPALRSLAQAHHTEPSLGHCHMAQFCRRLETDITKCFADDLRVLRQGKKSGEHEPL